MLSIWITSRPSMRVSKWISSASSDEYLPKGNLYKRLELHLVDESRVQERQQVKDQQLYAPAQTWQRYFMQGHMIDVKRCRATSGERNVIEHIKAPIFLEAVLAIEIMWKPKLSSEENLRDLKRWFLLINRSSHFNIIATVILGWSNKTSWVFKHWNQKFTSCPKVL